MDYPSNLVFNPKPPTLMHIDLNSCFATIEQQANPLLRGKPIAVAAYDSPSGCILAPSVEAKRLGVKVGMRVKEGKILCSSLQVLPPDPWKYRNIHIQLRDLIGKYTNVFSPKSIDEFILNFEGYPTFKMGMKEIGKEIKQRIKSDIGDWLTVSIGIGPNRFLAKLAAGLKKPDGLETIEKANFGEVFNQLKLDDLPGIKRANVVRLNQAGIYNLRDFYGAEVTQLRAAFKSILGYYWYLRIRGWEIDDVDFGRKSFGNMYSLPKPLIDSEDLAPILHKLVEKCTFRMRRAGYSTKGIHVGLLYRDHSFWHRGKATSGEIYNSGDIYRAAYKIMTTSPYRKPVANLAVSVFNLKKSDFSQMDLFGEMAKKIQLTKALDKINEKWGDFVITPAMMLSAKDNVPDRVPFGNIKELEQFVFG